MTLASLIPIALQSSIFLLVLSLGLHADYQQAVSLFLRPRALLRGLVSMAVVVPAFAIAMVLIFDLPHTIEVTLVAVALSPVPPFLPLKAMKAGGEREYTIGLLVAAAVLSIVAIPLILALLDPLFPAHLSISPASIASLVAITVLAPLAVGMTVHRLAPSFAAAAARPVLLLAAGLMLLALVPVLVTAWPAVLSLVGNGTVLVLAALVAVGLASGYLLGGPLPAERTVLGLASGCRHPGVAIAMAHANFPDDKLVMPAVLIYLLAGALVSMPFVQWAKRRSAVPGAPLAGG